MDATAVSVSTSQTVLDVVQYAYAPVLLVTFLIAFTARSIILSRQATAQAKEEANKVILGPGGKPLPKKKKINKKSRGKQGGKDKDQKDETESVVDFSKPRKRLFECLSAVVCITFIASAADVIGHALIKREEGWWCGHPPVFYIVGGFSVYSLLLITVIDNVPSPTTAQLGTWLLALVLEIIIFGSSLAVYTNPHRERQIRTAELFGPLRKKMTTFEQIEISIDAVRILAIAALAAFYISFVKSRNDKRKAAEEATRQREASETTPLLSSGTHSPQSDVEGSAVHNTSNGHQNGYASIHVADGSIKTRDFAASGLNATSAPTTSNGPNQNKQQTQDSEPAGWEKQDKPVTRSWWEYLESYTVLFPYLWPSKDIKLQIIVGICVLLVTAQRVVQVAVVVEVGTITDHLSGGKGPVRIPWVHILFYIGLRLLQGSGGFLNAFRQSLWIPVSQYSYRELSIAVFEHVHSLSLDFHLGKKTGEVISAMGKGASVNNFLENVTFQILPMLFDLVVAFGYFFIAFDPYYALIVALVTFWYIYVTIRLAQWRTEVRREMTNSSRDKDAVMNDSMVSYETVKYFNAEDYEFQRYRNSVNRYQGAEYLAQISFAIMNVTQNAIFMFGLLAASFLAAYQVSAGQRTVGDFVKLLTYMAQLQQPLNFFGTFFRSIQQQMINSERMLELLKEAPKVVDGPGAEKMHVCNGEITFSDVQFSYDLRKPALTGLDFRCPAGTTTALVGESGGGKSTIFRLMYRFYDPSAGRILVDGHEVHDVTIDSLRSHIGVVPQDTVLFNESIMYNLRYARQSATDEEIFDACRAASIHDKIMSFPDGYETTVGERGLRLSGGEKQRVAIARTIIKNPRIIMLDEATASLDSETEQHIQESLETLARGRTTLVIAHRLSTIRNADQILVLDGGRVAEKGTHDELMELNGKYKTMWRRQDRANKAEKLASEMKLKADKLRLNVTQGGSSPTTSEDDDSIGGQAKGKAISVGESLEDKAANEVDEKEMLIKGMDGQVDNEEGASKMNGNGEGTSTTMFKT